MTEPGLASATDSVGEPLRQTPAQRYATIWIRTLAEDTSTDHRPDSAPAPADGSARTPVDADSGETTAAGEATEAPTTLTKVAIAVVGVAWLTATLWTTHAALTAPNMAPADIASAAALALPSLVTASLLAGACVGLAVAGFAAQAAMVRRGLLGLAGGAVIGAAAAAVIMAVAGTTSEITTLAVTVGVAGVLGGAAAALPLPIFTAGIYATMAYFAISVLASEFQSSLKSLLGAGDTLTSQLNAAWRLAILTAIISGVAAGLLVYRYLRQRTAGSRWPAYLAAGAFPGLLLLVSEGLTLIGGARLFDLVSNLSANDRATLSLVGGGRLNTALTVGFVGAITAMIAVGRTMRRPADEDDDQPAQSTT